jgi:hypothetical protein
VITEYFVHGNRWSNISGLPKLQTVYSPAPGVEFA